MLTAIYDGHCVICQTTKGIIGRLDWFQQVQFLDLHQPETLNRRFPMIDRAAAMGQIHVIDEQGRLFAGFAGTRRLLRAVPLGWPFYAIFRLPIVGNWIGPKVYRFIAKHRYQINRLFGVNLGEMDDVCERDVCRLQ